MAHKIDNNILNYCHYHTDRSVYEVVVSSFYPVISRTAWILNKKYPQIDLEDLIADGYERIMICIGKYYPPHGAFTFAKMLKMSLYFSMRRFCLRNLTIVKRSERTWLSNAIVPMDLEFDKAMLKHYDMQKFTWE